MHVGDELYSPTADPGIVVLLSGAVAVEQDGAAGVIARPGDSIGAFKTLTGSHARRRTRVTAAGTALTVDRRPLFDLLADHVELLQSMFGALLRRKARADAAIA